MNVMYLSGVCMCVCIKEGCPRLVDAEGLP